MIVPYCKAQKFIDQLICEPWNKRSVFRKLQRFSISIEKRLHARLLAHDYIHEVKEYPGLFMLNAVLYDNKFGFIPPDETNGLDPEKFIE